MMAHNFWPTQSNLTVLYALLMPKTFSGPKAKSEWKREREREREMGSEPYIHISHNTYFAGASGRSPTWHLLIPPGTLVYILIDRSTCKNANCKSHWPLSPFISSLSLSLSLSLRRRLPVCVFINFLFDFCFMACSLWHHSQMSETRDSSFWGS